MRIKSLTLKNYKSFKGTHKVSLGEKSIVLGRNGSGKSNLLSALFSVFMHDKFKDEEKVQYNKNEEESFVEVVLENKERRLAVDSDKVIIRKKFAYSGTTCEINGKSVTKDELVGLFESAGLHKYNFISQGFDYISDVANLINRVSGANKFEEVKKIVNRNLDASEIDDMLEKLEYKKLKYNDFVQKMSKFDELDKKRKGCELELAKDELSKITKEIEQIEKNNAPETKESDELVELKIEEVRRNILGKMKEKHAIISGISHVENIDILNSLIISKNEQEVLYRIMGKKEAGAIENLLTKTKVLENSATEKGKLLEAGESKKTEKEILIQAIKYFDAMGTKKEELDELVSKLKDLKVKSKQNIVKSRKEAFLKKNQLKEEQKRLSDKVSKLQNRLLYLGNQQINIYDHIKETKGVLGCVYDLIDVDTKYLKAFEAVAKNTMYYVVVENTQVAKECIQKIGNRGRCTFIDLSRLNPGVKNAIGGLNMLSDFIRPNNPNISGISNLINFITKNYYVSPEIEKALGIRNRYSVNVVTLDGESIERNGSITGGYERNNECLLELVRVKKEYADITDQLKQFIDLDSFDLNTNIQKEAYLKYLEFKIELHKNKKIKLNKVEDEEKELRRICSEIEHLKKEIVYIGRELDNLNNNNKLMILKKIKQVLVLNKELCEIKLEETSLINQLYNENTAVSGEMLGKRNILLEKRSKLMKKHNILSMNNLVEKDDVELNQIKNNLKSVLTELKVYSSFNFNVKNRERMMDLDRVRDELNELKNDKQNIEKYVEYLEKIKDERIGTVFDSVAHNFAEIFHFITGNKISLEQVNNQIQIKLDDEIIENLNGLSGGQKTTFSLALMLAVQRTDPSPLYIFDEIDANLDSTFCSRVYDLLRETNAQFVISTFKNISNTDLGSGTKYFGVMMEDKTSQVGEISKEAATESLKR
ncbi:SMC3 [Enterospora canceri]|uniref:SMC3 n=1 Tax=Enterospora canceri TaxID=1081671 RepID=A0A1Y1S6T7_9MICR|nr:SMC3 [Enterospora canceri]